MQTPSVGRIVHYVSHGSPVRADGTQQYLSECRAAVITEVGPGLLPEGVDAEIDSDAEVVGLCVLNPTGLFFRRGVQDEHGRAGAPSRRTPS